MQAQPALTGTSPSPSLAAEPQLIAVNPALIGDVVRVPRVAALIADLERRHDGEISLAAIVEKCVRMDWVMWLAVMNRDVLALACAELYFDPAGMKRCRLPVCTGDDAKGWVHLFAQIEDWARREGCVKFDLIARKGWAKHLPDYRMTHVVLEKVL